MVMWTCRNLFLSAVVWLSPYALAAQRYPASGLVLRIDPANRALLVSCRRIPGYMEAMAMPIAVRDSKLLEGLVPGTTVEFTLVIDRDRSYAENIHVKKYSSTEREPLEAGRLKLLQGALAPGHDALAVGQSVPDFSLIDQSHRPVRLSQFAGKVIGLNFVYTRCALPDYCVRLSNNFGSLQKRFSNRLGHDLVLLTVTFDPVHDDPGVLAKYAHIWNADGRSWRFLTGPISDIQHVCSLFGLDAWPDEALLTHSLHTAIIDREGKLAANLEGNQFTPAELGDLVETVMNRGK
jgi:protein SCO1